MNALVKENAFFRIREPINALTHLIGFLAAIPVMIVLLFQSSTLNHIISFTIFGVSLMLLYGASTIYHTTLGSKKIIATLRRIDHMMIFILIAGTYTPICLVNLKGIVGLVLLVLVWGFAIFGILLKIFFFDAPRWLSTTIYVIMGWLVLFAFYPLMKAVPLSGILILLAGGLSYTVGAVIYAFKKPHLNFKNFGFHEIFHVFVMIGSTFHIVFMFLYVV